MNLLIAGATGNLGAHICRFAKQQGHFVRILTRKQDHNPEFADEIHPGDITNPVSLNSSCSDIDYVISAAGASLDLSLKPGSGGFDAVDYSGNVNLLEKAKRSGITKFVYISVFHHETDLELSYVNAHARFEKELMRSGMDYRIIRPMGYFSAFKAVFDLSKKGIVPLLGDGSALSNPIHDADLAEFVLQKLNDEPGIYSAGGPETLSRKAIFELACAVHGRKPTFIPVPLFIPKVNSFLLKAVDPRLSDLISFLVSVSLHNYEAEKVGKQSLESYFRFLKNS